MSQKEPKLTKEKSKARIVAGTSEGGGREGGRQTI